MTASRSIPSTSRSNGSRRPSPPPTPWRSRSCVTARSENFLHGVDDLDDTVRRLQAFEAAGADVLYAPGLPDLDAVRRVCAER